MMFDQPHLYEIESMIQYAKMYSRLYIYGCAENQEYLAKYLDICDIRIDGYVTTQQDERRLCYRDIPKLTIDEVDLENAGIIIGLSDKYYDGVIPQLRKRGYHGYFLMSEHNKRAIAHKMTPRPRDRMWIEINLADHCNLNCQMCDHFSHLAPPTFLELDEFRCDMERLAELSGHKINAIKLQGGEPLLHKDTNRFIEITRKLFPDTIIAFFTNGLSLLNAEYHPSGNFWKCCKDNDVEILMTRYPINLDTVKIRELADQYDADLEIFGEAATRNPHGSAVGLYTLPTTADKNSTKHPFDLSGSVGKHCFISCYHLNETITLRHGKLYTCSIRPYSHYFNEVFNQQLELSEDDCIDIYKANSYEELAEFMTKRIPFCRYCDIAHRRTFKWARSERTMDEYVD